MADLQQLLNTPQITCKACGGTGIKHIEAFWSEHFQRQIEAFDRECHACDGAGHFTLPVFAELWPLIKGRKRLLRSARPKNSRAYFVWRMVRFHTGIDVCLPMAASMELGSDPYRPLLDAMAKALAQKATGRRSAGAARWQAAMYGSPVEADLPATAHPGGPVVIGDKPECEQLELV